MDADVLAERILLDLKNTFKKDPLIDEFDILPVHESIRNTCPVIHVEHKIALEDWCVKHVYVYAYSKFFMWKKRPYKVDSETVLLWTTAILLINPEIETVWNARKEILCQNLLKVEDELKFSEIVLSRKPKSSQVFAHRKCVLLKLQKNQPSPCVMQQVIEHEFSLCTRVANLYASNYYAWCHRSWIIQQLTNFCFKIISEELTKMEQWVSTHISDYSGFHYRQFLISCLCSKAQCNQHSNLPSTCPLHKLSSNEESNKCNHFSDSDRNKMVHFHGALERELLFLCTLQTAYPGHEALWNHRRYILNEFQHMTALGELCPVKLNSTDGASVEDLIQCKRHKLESIMCNKLEWNLLKEEKFLNQCMKGAKSNEWEKILIERHIKWLQKIILWPVALSSS